MESETKNFIRVGSRKSELALIQTNFVIDNLKKMYPEKEFTIVSMTTLGDRVLNISLPKIGEKSLFTKDLEDGLRNKSLDFVVHSLKDLPTTLPEGLAIGAVFEREDPRDAVVLGDDFKDYKLSTLPEGSVVGTSSLRRTAQLRGAHPQLRVADIRGNLNTRLSKLSNSGQYAAILLASAGLHRMGWGDKISEVLPCAQMKYAVGQGALAVECRSDDTTVLNMLAPFNHPETYCRTLAERTFLKTLGGGCSAPVGVTTSLKKIDTHYELSITGAVWSLDGKTKLEHKMCQKFAQIHCTQKHKLSPTEDGHDCKKIKTDHIIPSEVTNNTCEESNNVDSRTKNSDIDNRIFSGFTINMNVPLDVILKCDNLGKDLADALIEKGALDVMKVTQDFIRSSIVKNT